MISLISAPSNLGLRPPQPGSVPGTAKAPEALRAAGLHRRLGEVGAAEAGLVLPGRYVDDDDVRAPGTLRNQVALIEHARRLAEAVGGALDAGHAPLVIGGDCSLLVGAGLSLARRSLASLIHVDGHTDFRNPGNSTACASLGGEDLAAAVGRHWPAIADIDGLGPYFAPDRTAHLGCRNDDEYLEEAGAALGLIVPAARARAAGMPTAADQLIRVAGRSGYWLQVDVDVLDPSIMPAVDSPDPGGLTADELIALLRHLAPGAAGASVTIFDPDLDPDGRYAEVVADVVAAGLAQLGTAAAR